MYTASLYSSATVHCGQKTRLVLPILYPIPEYCKCFCFCIFALLCFLRLTFVMWHFSEWNWISGLGLVASQSWLDHKKGECGSVNTEQHRSVRDCSPPPTPLLPLPASKETINDGSVTVCRCGTWKLSVGVEAKGQTGHLDAGGTSTEVNDLSTKSAPSLRMGWCGHSLIWFRHQYCLVRLRNSSCFGWNKYVSNSSYVSCVT